MTHEDLHTITTALHVAEMKIREGKGKDYGAPFDALAFFKEIEGRIQGVDRFLVCWILLMKSIVALEKLLSGGFERSESIRDRVLDARSYLTLFYALWEEELGKEKTCAVKGIE